MHRQTWVTVFVVVLILLAANLWCWRPGIGGGRDGSAGTELELFYGWPATYCAEWWRSEDPALGEELLRSVPFYSFAGRMESGNRYFGLLAAAADLAFAGAVLCTLAIVTESAVRRRRPGRGEVIALVIVSVVAVTVLVASERLSVHL